MTTLLQQAFKAAEKLPADTQDEIGAQLLESIRAELAWDECLENNAETLRAMAEQAEEDERAGRTEPLDPDTL